MSEPHHHVMAQEWAAGLTPPYAARPLFPHEVASGINFAQIDRQLAEAQQITQATLDHVRDLVITELVTILGHTATQREAARALADFTATQPPAVRAEIQAASELIAATLAQLYDYGLADITREAAHQHVTTTAVTASLGAKLLDYLDPAGTGPRWVWTQLAQAALVVNGTRHADATQVRDALMNTPIAQGYDLARQATHIAYANGRKTALQVLPEPAEVYASELLDKATCVNCEAVDGTEYGSLAAGLQDYPDSGVYAHCKGGDRCRGTLVVVWAEAHPQST